MLFLQGLNRCDWGSRPSLFIIIRLCTRIDTHHRSAVRAVLCPQTDAVVRSSSGPGGACCMPRPSTPPVTLLGGCTTVRRSSIAVAGIAARPTTNRRSIPT